MLLNCLNKRQEWIYALVLWNWHAVDEIKSIPNENLFIKPKMGNHRWKIMIDWLIERFLVEKDSLFMDKLFTHINIILQKSKTLY